MRFQIIIAVILVALLIQIFVSVKNHKLDFRHALSWILSGILLLIVAIFPGIMTWLAKVCGVEVPINMVFFFGIILSFVLIFESSKAISTLTERVKRLTQEVALLKKQIEEMDCGKEDKH